MMPESTSHHAGRQGPEDAVATSPNVAPVMAVQAWATNADMIADVARLGYLDRYWPTLDPTYGLGTWWRKFRPVDLTAHDLKTDGVDFRHLPHGDDLFQAVAFDPPYKLNGTPTGSVDGRYGVDVVQTRDERHQLIRDGITECARVLRGGGFLLIKCQDQVNGGKVRWQTDVFTAHAETVGLDKVDALHMIAYRPQPAGRPQQHARRNHSTLLVFAKPAPKARRPAQAELLGDPFTRTAEDVDVTGGVL